jgi:hypothetical protein
MLTVGSRVLRCYVMWVVLLLYIRMNQARAYARVRAGRTARELFCRSRGTSIPPCIG